MPRKALAQAWREIKKHVNDEPVETYIVSYIDPTEFSGGTDLSDEEIAVCYVAGHIKVVGEKTITIHSLWQEPDQLGSFRPTDNGVILPKGCITSIGHLRLDEVLWDDEEAE